MTNLTKLNILIPMCDFTTGEPVANLTPSLAAELGLKTDKDVKENRKQIPDLTISDILNQCFDLVPLATKTEFATYNNILIDIRNARRQKQDYIEIDKSDLELLKKIFEKGMINKPELNRRIGFIIEVLEQTIADIVTKNNLPKTNS